MDLRIGSICSGIGGLELGLEWAGVGHTVWQCEVDPFCRRVLARHWPDAIRFGDVRRLSRFPVPGELFPDYPPDCDLICAGFPCQDISVAGKGAGLDGARSGLWFEVLRVIAEVLPAWIALENVDQIRRNGLAEVLSGVADLGFDAEWHRFAAADVGAPHRRRRWFLIGWRPDAVADAARFGRTSRSGPAPERGDPAGHGADVADADGYAVDLEPLAGTRGSTADAGRDGEDRALADADRERRAQLGIAKPAGEQGAPWDLTDGRGAGRRRPGSSGDVGDADGAVGKVGPGQSGDPRAQRAPAARAGNRLRSRPGLWLAEPAVRRVVDGFPGRVDQLRALGNAVVPQNAEVIGWRLREIAARLLRERGAA